MGVGCGGWGCVFRFGVGGVRVGSPFAGGGVEVFCGGVCAVSAGGVAGAVGWSSFSVECAALG